MGRRTYTANFRVLKANGIPTMVKHRDKAEKAYNKKRSHPVNTIQIACLMVRRGGTSVLAMNLLIASMANCEVWKCLCMNRGEKMRPASREALLRAVSLE